MKSRMSSGATLRTDGLLFMTSINAVALRVYLRAKRVKVVKGRPSTNTGFVQDDRFEAHRGSWPRSLPGYLSREQLGVDGRVNESDVGHPRDFLVKTRGAGALLRHAGDLSHRARHRIWERWTGSECWPAIVQ